MFEFPVLFVVFSFPWATPPPSVSYPEKPQPTPSLEPKNSHPKGG